MNELPPSKASRDAQDFYGTIVTINEDVKYVGDGPDPKDDPYFMMVLNAYIKALKEQQSG